jgi:putative membrane protein
MLPLLLVLLFCILGVLTGVLTGILPGLHVNNIALIFLSMTGAIVSTFSFLFDFGISTDFILVLICVYIISVSISHTFHDIIPSTFLGAPDEDKALSVLPAHSLLLEGKGYEAVTLSAIGSYGAILFCFFLIYPIRFVIGDPLFFYESLREIMVFVLIAVSLLLLATEKAKIDIFKRTGKRSSIIGILFAIYVFLISGVFGIIVFELPVNSPIGLSSPVLFPALAGLFGTPTLLTSLFTKPKLPKQSITEVSFDKKTKKSLFLSVITGSLGGTLVSIIPGLTSSTGTVITMIARGKSDKKQTIITLSAVNTACAFFVVVIMFITLRARSGATLAVKDIVSVVEWTELLMPTNLVYFLIALIFGGTLSYFLTLKIGKLFAKHFTNIPYLLLIKLTICMVIILVFLFTGFIGVLVLVVATLIGLLPVQWGVRRSHCMGILLIPIILYFI